MALELALWLAISAGNEAAPCQVPTSVSYRAGEKCSGVMVHPRVMLTAAHCFELDTAATVRFGERFALEEYKIDIDECWVHPDWVGGGFGADDLVVCTLVEDVPVPVTPILAGCEAQALTPGTPALVSGWGPVAGGAEFGTKRYAFTEIASDARDDGTIIVGDASVSGCTGDSGGPAYVQLADGTWRVFGILSGGSACGSGASTYVLPHAHADWISSVAGLDLTPCHDDAGQWSPNPACQPAATDLLGVGAAWGDACPGPLAPRTNTCEAPQPETDGGSTSTGAATGCRAAPQRQGWWLLLLLVPRRRSRRRKNFVDNAGV